MELLNEKVKLLQNILKEYKKKVRKFQKYKSLHKRKYAKVTHLNLRHRVCSETANASLLDNTIATLKENNVLTERYRLFIIIYLD